MNEYIRVGTTYEAMSKLKPAFSKDGTVTAGNASGLNDAAACCRRDDRGGSAAARLDAHGAHRLLGDRRRRPGDYGNRPNPGDAKSAREGGLVDQGPRARRSQRGAFAAQALAVNENLGWDPAIVNVNGGAVAIGHPIGASGARILTTLLHEMARRNAKKGLATLCIGGDMGIAMAVER